MPGEPTLGSTCVLQHGGEGVVAEDVAGQHDDRRIVARREAGPHRPQHLVAADGVDPQPGGAHLGQHLAGGVGLDGVTAAAGCGPSVSARSVAQLLRAGCRRRRGKTGCRPGRRCGPADNVRVPYVPGTIARDVRGKPQTVALGAGFTGARARRRRGRPPAARGRRRRTAGPSGSPASSARRCACPSAASGSSRGRPRCRR